MASSAPSFINPRWKRMIKIRGRVIRGFVVGFTLGCVLTFMIMSAALS